MAGEPFVQLRNITKRFGGLMALGGVSLDVHPGEVLAIVGDNGAGKSTLIKILSGVYSATAGTIVVGGREVQINTANDARALGIETVHQSLGLVDTLNAWENFFLGNEIPVSVNVVVARIGFFMPSSGGAARPWGRRCQLCGGARRRPHGLCALDRIFRG